MEFEGEHLRAGQIGHFLVLLSFTFSLLSAISFFTAGRQTEAGERKSWIRLSRMLFTLQSLSVFGVFAVIFYICKNHFIEYLFAYKHTSRELEFKFLLACIWEDQSGSFLLWSIWHCLIGLFLMVQYRKSNDTVWEAPVMSIISTVQVFLAMMLMGIWLGAVKIGNSPFVLTRNEINGPIFQRPEYLSLIKDGLGLNVLLRNYWMVIHPPVLFLGFASTLIPFAYAAAALLNRKYESWIRPALPYTLFSAAVLGVGIMMGGKWAYESLSFGGYWAWDPVENASLVPWLVLVAGLHCMLIYNATGYSLRAAFSFVLLTFLFILYSTFLTRTGILGDTSVHAFTEAGKAMNYLILAFLLFFVLGGLGLLLVRVRQVPSKKKEEEINTREFWMLIGALVLFLSSLFISAKTSLPVINSLFGTKLAPPENVEFSYNKVMVMVAIVTGLLTAATQYLKYRQTPPGHWIRKIAVPTIISIALTVLIAFVYPVTYMKEGPGFLGAIYGALFASIYTLVANTTYIWTGLKGKWRFAGGSLAHAGFGLMIAGMLISSGNKKIISEERFKNFEIPMGIDPLTKSADNPAENMNLVRDVPNRMDQYTVTYLNDSAGHEKGRRYFNILFEEKDNAERFMLRPDVYLMKDNNMSSNPDIKTYLTHDIFTYISYALNPEKNSDTSTFKIHELSEGDTFFYRKGYIRLDRVVKNPQQNKFRILPKGPSVMAVLSVNGSDSIRREATPMVVIDSFQLQQFDDTVYAQNLFLRFAGITDDGKKIKIGIREPDTMIDFVTIKAYRFPYIILVWLGLIIMAIGFTVSSIHRAGITGIARILLLAGVGVALFYLFLLAG